MNIVEAQREMRSAFLGGFGGQLVAGVIWAASAAVGTWIGPAPGMATLFFGCMLLFPLTQLLLRALGRPAQVGKDNSLNGLARQIAFTVPLNFLLVGAATLYKQNWFYPAAMIAVGTHYLPFMFLYGMREFGVLAALLIAGAHVLGATSGADFVVWVCGWQPDPLRKDWQIALAGGHHFEDSRVVCHVAISWDGKSEHHGDAHADRSRAGNRQP